MLACLLQQEIQDLAGNFDVKWEKILKGILLEFSEGFAVERYVKILRFSIFVQFGQKRGFVDL